MTEKATILIVDDTPDNLSLMSEILKDEYKIKIANNGEKALKIALGESRPDLILLDIMMPVMDGYEVCRRLKGNPATQDIPVIFLTAKAEEVDEKLGLELGAVDYITKPISIPILLARTRNHLQLKLASDILRDQNTYLEDEVQRRTAEVGAVQDVTILMLASLADARDSDTGNHVKRSQMYVKALANKLKSYPRFSSTLTDSFIDMLFKSAPLHDIGKVGIPDAILKKPGRLDPEEFEIMKTHTTIGRIAIENAEKELGKSVDFLDCAKQVANYHQEKWDSSGYPEGIGGDTIPVSARIMAIADVYDALISERIYKPGLPHEKAVSIILEGRGTHFDPDMVDAFLEIADEFKAIAARFNDTGIK